MFKTSKFMFLALFLATVGLLYNASAPSASTHANPVPEVAAAVRVFAEVQDIPGFRMPDWLSDNQGRTWVEDLPLDTYIVFKLPQPLSRILFQWMSSANYNYSETRYGAPKSYQIQISSDSADGIDGKWVTAADIQNNLVAARAHEIKGENIRWIRLRVTEGGTSIDEIDIHDLSRCQAGAYPDTWAFIGDSITADSFWRDAAAGKPFNARVNEICPERYPSMINLGIGGDNAKTLYERLQHTIDLNPGAYFWAVGIGTNGSENEEQYESYLRKIIQMLRENGKQPIVARIPYINIVYSLHVYDAWADGGDRFDRYFQDAKNRGLCVIIGEFGVMRGNAKQQSAVIAMYNSAIRHNIGRMYWAWDDSALPMTTEGCGWQIDKTDKAMPTNLTWAGELVWLDNRGRLSANLAIARPTASAVVVNGKNTAFDAYNIGGSNYFKLRDIAYVLSGSEKQFEVGWDGKKNAISLTSGAPYTPVGGEMAKKADGDKTAMPTSSDIFLDGKQIVLTAYNIGGYNYFKLRDMGRVLDFGVDWDEARNTIVIDTKKNYAPGPQNATSGSAWTQTSYNFQDLAELKNRSVFFAHNSVGQNIIDGLKALESSLIVGGVQAGAKGIAENYMGFNGDPAGKLGAFEKLLDEGGHRAQIAFFKFCYADFQAHTDVDGLFGEYTAKLGILGEKYPDITFIHVTVPLYHYNASWNNRVQHAFNEKLRAMYGALVFDLAAIESVDSLGNIALSRDGVTPALAEEWTDDGSHLNAAGGKRLASALIAFLAQVPLKK